MFPFYAADSRKFEIVGADVRPHELPLSEEDKIHPWALSLSSSGGRTGERRPFSEEEAYFKEILTIPVSLRRLLQFMIRRVPFPRFPFLLLCVNHSRAASI